MNQHRVPCRLCIYFNVQNMTSPTAVLIRVFEYFICCDKSLPWIVSRCLPLFLLPCIFPIMFHLFSSQNLSHNYYYIWILLMSVLIKLFLCFNLFQNFQITRAWELCEFSPLFHETTFRRLQNTYRYFTSCPRSTAIYWNRFYVTCNNLFSNAQWQRRIAYSTFFKVHYLIALIDFLIHYHVLKYLAA